MVKNYQQLKKNLPKIVVLSDFFENIENLSCTRKEKPCFPSKAARAFWCPGFPLNQRAAYATAKVLNVCHLEDVNRFYAAAIRVSYPVQYILYFCGWGVPGEGTFPCTTSLHLCMGIRESFLVLKIFFMSIYILKIFRI